MPIGIGAAVLGSAGLSAGSSFLGGRRAGKAISAANADAQMFAAMARREARAAYAPYEQAGSGAINKLGDILVDNELDPNEVIRQTPGYKFQFEEGQRALERSQASRGMLNSGQTGRALAEYGQNMASTAYDTYINRLGQLAGIGLGAVGGRINAEMGTTSMQVGAGMNAGMAQAQNQLGMFEGFANAGNAAAGNLITADMLDRLYPTGGTTSKYGVN